ncbi:MAG: membrane dipeptidase [Rhodospirillales bacterium]
MFRELRDGGIDAVHVTIAYHEMFRETVANIETWNVLFQQHADMIMPGRWASDIEAARESDRTAIFFGFQNCSPIEDDIGLVEIVHTLGARFMQLSYNNQSLLATGCYEAEDPGLTRMGKGVVREMNRVGLVVDMSHSAERSTLDAIETSTRPIAITHANPTFWHAALRNKTDTVLKALGQSGGMIGLSLYPHHLKDGSHCTLESFCEMAAKLADLIGPEHIGIGSDLCRGQPDSVVEWMRTGRWSKEVDYGEGSRSNAGFPEQPQFFRTSADFPMLAGGLIKAGFAAEEADGIVGGNWLRFFETSFGPA